MPSFPIIDVALGLVFTYLTLSLVITATNELIASVLSRRQKTLLLGIKNLLGDDLADAVYAHPLIRSLSNNGNHPSYIPSRTFALALLDVIEPAIAAIPPPSPQATDARVPALQARFDPNSPASAGSNATPLLPAALRREFRVLLAEAEHNVELFKVQIEEWFNNGMERVSGWYKRETQFILLILALVLTVSVNADTLKIIRTLWRDPTVRTETVLQAQAYLDQIKPKNAGTNTSDPPPDDVQAATKKLAEAMNQLNTTALPLGWDKPCTESSAPCLPSMQPWPGRSVQAWQGAFTDHILGWLMTALAISLGAPFWFDTLNRVMSIRGAGKSPEEQPRQPKSVPQPREPGQVP